MADWYGNRHGEKYTYKRVSWSNWAEHETYDFITSGSLELSSDSDLKVTGSFAFEGDAEPDTDDLVRVYYSFRDDSGELVSVPLATLFWSYSAETHYAMKSGMKESGDLDATSVLYVLQSDLVGLPYTVNRNANCIYEAQKIIKEHGLNVEFTPSIRVLSADHTFDAGTSYLEIVNWLCGVAGYTDACPDAMGTVRLRPLEDVLLQQEPLLFANDDLSIMYPEVLEENNTAETFNVVRLLYNTDTACIVAEARNVSGSKGSLDKTGGRARVYFEETGEVDPTIAPLDSLTDQAEQILRDVSSDIEYIQFSHAYIPMQPYDPVEIVYADRTWTGNAQNIAIEFTPGTKTQTRVVRVLYEDIQVEKSGRAVRT